MSVFTCFLCWYLFGVFTYTLTGLGMSMMFSIILAVLTLIGVIRRRFSVQRLIGVIGAIVGVVSFSLASEPLSTVLDNYIERYIEVEGVVCEIPDNHDEYFSYVLRAEKLRYANNEIDLDSKLHITSKEEFDTGNRVALRGFLDEPSGPRNSTEFNYKNYLRSKGISYSLHAEEVQVVSARVFIFSPIYWTEYIKSRVATAIDRFYSDDDAGIIKAVLLGQRSEFTDGFKKILIRTSALRFLYPSFLHIFFLLSVCELIFMAIPKRKREVVFAVAVLIYALFLGNYMTFVRSSLILAFVILYRRLRGFSHYTDIVSMIVAVCLVANPLLIYNSGFVISVVMGILLHMFRRPVSERLTFIRSKNIRAIVAIWIIGVVGIMPFSAYYFNGAPIYSIIFTFIYTPLSIALFILAPISLVFYELLGSAGIFGIITDIVIDLMQKIPQMVALLPCYYLSVAKTTTSGFVASGIIMYLAKCIFDKNTKTMAFKTAAAALSGIIILTSVNFVSDYGKMKITFVNVGQGDGAIIDIVGKDTLLLDGGGGTADSKYNIGENVFLPYLAAKGYSKIDLAIVSHCHRDHAEGIVAAIENLNVKTVMLSECDEGREYREKIINAAEKSGTEILYVSAGDSIQFESGLVIEVLSPYKNEVFENENDYSLALKLEYDGTSMFFGGDISSDIEKRLIGKLGAFDIVKVSHHGSDKSSCKEFISEAKPRYAVFCVGKNNMHGHPAERVLYDYAKSGAKILRTDIMNDIEITCHKGKIGAVWHGEVMKWR